MTPHEIELSLATQIVAVTAEISGDHDLGSTVAAVKSPLDQPGSLPPNIYYSIGGQYRQQQLAISGMVKVFVAAVIAEFALLLFLYESFALSLVIILGSPISISAVFLGLWITGVELNITAMMGPVGHARRHWPPHASQGGQAAGVSLCQ